MNQAAYRKLVSGLSTGVGSSLLRLVLGLAACGYSLVIRLRNTFYSKGWFRAHRANAAVISIGNITAGGTGKTPLVVWLCNEITQNLQSNTENYQCAVLTRGYKAGQGPLLDEPAILAESCPGARVAVNPNRVAGASEAISLGANVLIMDDGFQHRRLARDLDIVAIDATIPFGYGRILPAGLLREPVAGLKRADAIVITRSDQATEAQLTEIENRIRAHKTEIVIARSVHAPVSVEYREPLNVPAQPVIPAKAGIQKRAETMDSCLRRNDGIAPNDSLEELKGKKVFAFCGIGNPDAFLNTVKGLDAELLGSQIFDDHHHYAEACLAGICTQAERLKVDLVLTTQKDWTKIAPLLTDETRLCFAFLAVEMRFQAGKDKLRGLIDDVLAGRICGK